MKRTLIILSLATALSIPSIALAFETAPRITDREIVERLTRLEEKLTKVEEGQRAILREMDKRFEAIDKQFSRLVHIFLGILGAFVTMFGGTIWFALWDRRTMIKPFEDRVRNIEGDIAENRSKLHSFIDAFRTLSKTDEKVAEVLKRFNLL
ncbi:MAG: hypothetical protein A3G70_08015 [Planctomycetes bacterium RIFCSPLOWO2_12_FULL_39_13]|nr:MAG: hypothetical protein A3G70_08015 [Planctomycetes bacterium RIFCSPLOWO2_12_FULL_39_13]